MKNKNLIKKIKMAMLKKDINQSDLADKLGITKSVVSNWFIGNRNPKIETLEKIAKVLGTDVNYFLNDDLNEDKNFSKNKKNENGSTCSIDMVMELIKELRNSTQEKFKRLELEIKILKNKIENSKKN